MTSELKRLEDAIHLVETYTNQLPALHDESDRDALLSLAEEGKEIVERIRESEKPK